MCPRLRSRPSPASMVLGALLVVVGRARGTGPVGVRVRGAPKSGPTANPPEAARTPGGLGPFGAPRLDSEPPTSHAGESWRSVLGPGAARRRGNSSPEPLRHPDRTGLALWRSPDRQRGRSSERPQGASVPDPTPTSASATEGLGEFVARHIGPDDAAVAHMLEAIGHESLGGAGGGRGGVGHGCSLRSLAGPPPLSVR